MSSQFITLQGITPGPDRPRVTGDDILPAQGALLLMDVTHPTNPYAGTLAHGDQLPNLALAQAQAMTGKSAVALTPTILRTSGSSAWRTPKGQIQWQRTPENGFGSLFPIGVLEYMAANIGHRFFFSWGGGYVGGSGINGFVTYATLDPAAGTGNGFVLLTGNSSGQSNTATGPRSYYEDRVYTGTAGGAAAALQARSRLLGNMTPAPGPSTGQMCVGFVYIEDLTVSGRSPGQAAAAHAVKYSRLYENPGGRYQGDTYAIRS